MNFPNSNFKSVCYRTNQTNPKSLCFIIIPFYVSKVHSVQWVTVRVTWFEVNVDEDSL